MLNIILLLLLYDAYYNDHIICSHIKTRNTTSCTTAALFVDLYLQSFLRFCMPLNYIIRYTFFIYLLYIPYKYILYNVEIVQYVLTIYLITYMYTLYALYIIYYIYTNNSRTHQARTVSAPYTSYPVIPTYLCMYAAKSFLPEGCAHRHCE